MEWFVAYQIAYPSFSPFDRCGSGYISFKRLFLFSVIIMIEIYATEKMNGREDVLSYIV